MFWVCARFQRENWVINLYVSPAFRSYFRTNKIHLPLSATPLSLQRRIFAYCIWDHSELKFTRDSMQSGYPGYEPLILSIPTCNIGNSLPELFREDSFTARLRDI